MDEIYLSFPKRASLIRSIVWGIPNNAIKEPILGPSLWPSKISYKLLNQSLRLSKLFSFPMENTNFWISSPFDDCVSLPKPNESSLRASAGIGLSWLSPFGPVKFYLSKAILKENYDKNEIFRFSFGTTY